MFHASVGNELTIAPVKAIYYPEGVLWEILVERVFNKLSREPQQIKAYFLL